MPKILNLPILIILLAIIVRLAAVLILGPADPSGGDFSLFDRMARNLLAYGDFHGEPAATYGSPNINPGFALFLALLYGTFGKSAIVVIGAQIVLGVLIVWAVYLLGLHVFNKKTGLIAALITALWPTLVFQTIEYGQSTLLFTALFVFSVLFFWLAIQKEKAPYAFLAGAFLGLAALTESIAFYMPLAFGLWLLLLVVIRRFAQFRKLGLAFLMFIVAFALVLAPWAYRNVKVAQEETRILAKGELQIISPQNIKKITGNTIFIDGFLSQALERMFLRPYSYAVWRLEAVGKSLPLARFINLLHAGLLALTAFAFFTCGRRPFNLLILLLLAYTTVAAIGFVALRGGNFNGVSPLSVFTFSFIPLFAVLTGGLIVQKLRL